MTGMTELSNGDTVEHNEFGQVTFRRVSEDLNEAFFTDTGEEVIFEGGHVEETVVQFETEEGDVVEESVATFIAAVFE